MSIDNRIKELDSAARVQFWTDMKFIAEMGTGITRADDIESFPPADLQFIVETLQKISRQIGAEDLYKRINLMSENIAKEKKSAFVANFGLVMRGLCKVCGANSRQDLLVLSNEQEQKAATKYAKELANDPVALGQLNEWVAAQEQEEKRSLSPDELKKISLTIRDLKSEIPKLEAIAQLLEMKKNPDSLLKGKEQAVNLIKQFYDPAPNSTLHAKVMWMEDKHSGEALINTSFNDAVKMIVNKQFGSPKLADENNVNYVKNKLEGKKNELKGLETQVQSHMEQQKEPVVRPRSSHSTPTPNLKAAPKLGAPRLQWVIDATPKSESAKTTDPPLEPKSSLGHG